MAKVTMDSSEYELLKENKKLLNKTTSINSFVQKIDLIKKECLSISFFNKSKVLMNIKKILESK